MKVNEFILMNFYFFQRSNFLPPRLSTPSRGTVRRMKMCIFQVSHTPKKNGWFDRWKTIIVVKIDPNHIRFSRKKPPGNIVMGIRLYLRSKWNLHLIELFLEVSCQVEYSSFLSFFWRYGEFKREVFSHPWWVSR